MRIKENCIGFYTLVHREVSRILRIWPQTLLPPVITMTLYFSIFGTLIGPRIGKMQGFSYIDYIVPGLVMMSVITNAYTNVVSSFFGSKFQRNIEEMLVSPMPNSVILWGFICGGMLRGLLIGFIVTMVSLFFTNLHIEHLGITCFIVLLTSILFSLAGLINGIFAKKFDDISIVPTFVLTPLTYLGGVFYSIELLPDIWQTVTHFNPVFYIINAFRFGVLGQSDIELGFSLLVIVAFILGLYAFSMRMLNSGYGIRS